MKKCAEFATNDSGRKHCARFEEVDGDIAMAKKDEDSLGYFDIGEVNKALGALTKIGMSDVIPPLVGGIGAVATTLLIKKFVKDPASILVKWAPVGGILGGVLLSIPLYWLYGKEGVIKGAVGSVIGGGCILAFDKLAPMVAMSGMGLLNVQRVGRVGAVVASGKGARALPTARVPSGIGSAMDIGAFASKGTY